MAISLKTLRKTFDYEEFTTVPTEDGVAQDWTKTAEVVGILAQATYRELRLGEQLDIAISHMIAQEGGPIGKARGRLVLHTAEDRPDRIFNIQRVENPGELDIYALYYAEEIVD